MNDRISGVEVVASERFFVVFFLVCYIVPNEHRGKKIAGRASLMF